MKNKITIAIDGFSSTGKSTVAKELAKALEYVYVDTGAMYRAVTLFALRNKLISEESFDKKVLIEKLPYIDLKFKVNSDLGYAEVFLNGENVEQEIRTLEVANGASRISTLVSVRKEMVRQQQEMGLKKGVVMDGRDIGTVVFPTAELKLFITASPEIRAQRRMDELKMKGDKITTYEEVLKNIKYRDHHDQNRKESPLRKADDAIVLDNSNVNIEQQLNWALDMYHKTISKEI